MKSKLSAILFEIIPVAIGVFLGFVVSNWTESSTKKRETQLLKENIVAEIKNNKNRLEQVIDYHRILRDSSAHYANNNIISEPHFFDGINTAILLKSAFDTGIQTGLINGLPLDLIQQTNNVYSIQEEYSQFKTIMLSAILNMNILGDDDGEKSRFYFMMALSMTDVVIHEEMLLELYDGLLGTMKSK